jgi:hypothetical protein
MLENLGLRSAFLQVSPKYVLIIQIILILIRNCIAKYTLKCLDVYKFWNWSMNPIRIVNHITNVRMILIMVIDRSVF